MRRHLLFAGVWLVAACGGAGSHGAANASPERLAALPGSIYARSAAGERAPLRRELEELVRPFVPVVPVSDEATVRARLERNEPVILDAQLDLMARAYVDGQLISRESFVGALAEHGVLEAGTGRPLTTAHLTRVLAPLARKRDLAEHEVVPALILALGHERASRTKSVTDSVWGDAWLDPLQVTLLLYSLGGLDAGAAKATAHGAAGLSGVGLASALPMFPLLQDAPWWRPSPVKVGVTILTGLVGKAVEMPLTWGQAAKTSLCASVLLNAHTLAVKAAPAAISRRAHRNYQSVSRLTAELHFEGVAKGQALLDSLCGKLPPPGRVPGKEIEWFVGDALVPHGRLSAERSTTDQQGVARTEFRAVDEAVPEPLRRGLAGEVNGPVHAVARGLVPGWKNLEIASNPGYWGPAANTARLSVHHYRPPSFVLAAVDGKSPPAVLYRHGEGRYKMGTVEVRGGALELLGDGAFRLHLTMRITLPGFGAETETSEVTGRWELAGDRLSLRPLAWDGEAIDPEDREVVHGTWGGPAFSHPFPVREDDRVLRTPTFSWRQGDTPSAPGARSQSLR